MKPNILLLIIDGLRSDKCYGISKTSITPTIDYIIKNGTYFEQAISAAPHTVPALASIFTSLFPFECLLQDKKFFKINTVISYIDDLRKYGYKTYALVPELISHVGIHDIFEKVESYPYYLKTYNVIGQKILEQLSNISPNEPWLFYIHLYDLQWITEWPKNKSQIMNGPNEIFDKKFGDNLYERLLSAMDVWLGKILQKINLEKTLVIITSDHGHEAAAYDLNMEEYVKFIQNKKFYKPGIMYKLSHKIIAKLPKFLFPLRQKLSRVYTNTKTKTINAKIQPEFEKIDHQNISTYEKRLRKQAVDYVAQLFDERFRIPLIFYGYGVPSNKLISQQVRSIDIFPTIGDIINLPNKNKKCRGTSLLPIIKGEKTEEHIAFLESAVNSPLSATANVIGIRTNQYKYFRKRNNPHEGIHLFDLRKDPYEEKNIASNNSAIIEKMEKYLKEFQDNKNFNYTESYDITEKKETEKIEQELKKLGYI